MNKEVLTNKEVSDALHCLFHCARKDNNYETQYQQFRLVYDYINQLEEKIRISQEHPFLSKEAFEKLKKIKIEEDKEIEYIKGDYTLPVRPAKENEAFISGCLFAHENKINELVKAVNELKKGKQIMLALIWVGIILAELEMLKGWVLIWYITSIAIKLLSD